MSLLTVITILIIISAIFSYLNERLIKLPSVIGVVIISMVISIIILIIGKSDTSLKNSVETFAHNIDFSNVLLNIMLGFLLFASGFHFDYQKLKEQRLAVLILSTLGVLISTAVFGGLLFLINIFFNIDLPIIYCFLFGAIISPTDPIAVEAILKKSTIPSKLNTIISGESLFNDGVGLILFVVILGISNKPESTSFIEILHLFGQEVLGGILIGLLLGYLGFHLIRSIKDFQTIFLISIAIVLAISVTANRFQASIPLAAVTAGLIMGNKSVDKNNIAHQFLGKVWQLVNDLLNTILFVMIGLQLVTMPFLREHWISGVASIIIILLARIVSVALPSIAIIGKLKSGHLFILTWAGLRGGISVAMALMLPPSPYREIIVSSCYFVVIFSIIIQGLTLKKVVDKSTHYKVG